MDVRDGSFFAWMVSLALSQLVGWGVQKTHLSIGSRDDQDVNTVDLSLLERSGLVLSPQIRCRVQQNPLLSITDILLVLTTQHALDCRALKVLDDLVDNLGHIPVLGSGLDCSHSDLSGIVGGLDDIGGNAIHLGGEDNGLGVSDGVSVKLNTEHDLDDITVFEDNLGIGR
jgi:hypothetical protein